MARRRNRNRLLVPGAREAMTALQTDVLRQKGYNIEPAKPESAKMEVAKSLGVPLSPGNNGALTTEDAGKIGGEIGGTMMRELVRRAQLQLMEKRAEYGREQR